MSYQQPAILFVRVPAVETQIKASYEKWYDNSHIEYRMDKPDFLGAERYDVLLGKHRYFVFYELSSVAALTSAEYLELRKWESEQPVRAFEAFGRTRPGFERGVYEQVAGPQWAGPRPEAPIAVVAGYNPPVEDEEPFGAWFDDVHGSAVKRIPGLVALRRFVLTKSLMGAQSGMRTDRPRCLAVYYLAAERVASDAAFLRELQAASVREGAPEGERYVIAGKLVHAARSKRNQAPA